MNILAKFRKIIFRLFFFRIVCKRLRLKTVNQSQYIWVRELYNKLQQLVELIWYWRIDLLNFL